MDKLILPADLQDVYRKYLQRELKPANNPQPWEQQYRPVLGLLAVSRGDGLNREQIQGILKKTRNIRRSVVSDVLDRCVQYLTAPTGAGPYRFYHQSFREYLLSSDEFFVYPEEAHEDIANYYWENHRSNWKNCDHYGLSHIPLHMVGAEQDSRLRELLLDFNYYYAKLTGSTINDLLDDFELLSIEDEDLRLVESALRMSAHVLNDAAQLAGQLIGRLEQRINKSTEINSLLDAAQSFDSEAALILIDGSLSLAGGALLRTIQIVDANFITLTQDGRRLIVANHNTVTVFDTETWDRLITFSLHTDHVSALAVQGEIVLSSSYDKTIKVWRWTTGELITDFTLHDDIVFSVAVQGEIAISSSRGVVKVWHWHTGELITDFLLHKTNTKLAYMNNVTTVALQDEFAISGANDKTVKVWRWVSGELVTDFTQHDEDVVALVVQGELVFSASRGGVVRSGGTARKGANIKVWRRLTGELVTEFRLQSWYVQSLTVQGEMVFCTSGDNIEIWNWQTGEKVGVFSQHTSTAFSVAVDGEVAYSSSEDQTVKLWQWRGIDEPLTGHRMHRNAVFAVSAQGKFAFSASADGTVKVWRWATRDLISNFTLHGEPVHEMIVQGDTIFTASQSDKDKNLKVWEWETGHLLRELPWHTDNLSALAIQGEIALSASGDGLVIAWRLDTGEIISTFSRHLDYINSVFLQREIAFSASQDNSVKVWNWRTGELVTDFDLHVSNVIDVVAHGDIAFSASQDQTVKVWHWATGELFTDFRLHRDLVETVVVHGDVAFSASSREVMAWNWRSGEWLASFVADSFLIYSLAYEPSENILLVGTISGDVHVLRTIGMDKMLRTPTLG